MQVIPITVILRDTLPTFPGKEELGQPIGKLTRNIQAIAFKSNKGRVSPESMVSQSIDFFWDTPGFSRNKADVIIGKF